VVKLAVIPFLQYQLFALPEIKKKPVVTGFSDMVEMRRLELLTPYMRSIKVA
jgi:hypothetical protein